MTVFLPKVDIQDVSQMFSLGCEFLPAVFTGVDLYRRRVQALAQTGVSSSVVRKGSGRHLAGESPE